MCRFKYPSLTHGACFTIYDTGNATTGGKDSDLRQAVFRGMTPFDAARRIRLSADRREASACSASSPIL